MCLHKLHKTWPHLWLLRRGSPPPAGSLSSVHLSIPSFFSSPPFSSHSRPQWSPGQSLGGGAWLGLKVCVLVSCLAVRPETLRRNGTSWGLGGGGSAGLGFRGSHYILDTPSPHWLAGLGGELNARSVSSPALGFASVRGERHTGGGGRFGGWTRLKSRRKD